jgi:hypothetical protein
MPMQVQPMQVQQMPVWLEQVQAKLETPQPVGPIQWEPFR